MDMMGTHGSDNDTRKFQPAGWSRKRKEFPEVVSVLFRIYGTVRKVIDHVELKLIPLIPHECKSFEGIDYSDDVLVFNIMQPCTSVGWW